MSKMWEMRVFSICRNVWNAPFIPRWRTQRVSRGTWIRCGVLHYYAHHGYLIPGASWNEQWRRRGDHQYYTERDESLVKKCRSVWNIGRQSSALVGIFFFLQELPLKNSVNNYEPGCYKLCLLCYIYAENMTVKKIPIPMLQLPR